MKLSEKYSRHCSTSIAQKLTTVRRRSTASGCSASTKAATRTAAIDVFVEALSERLKDWVKEQATEGAQWIKPSERLPEEQQEVLVLLDWRDSAQPLSEVLYSIAIFYMYASDEGNEPRWYTDDHGVLLVGDVAYWRPLPTPPKEMSK